MKRTKRSSRVNGLAMSLALVAGAAVLASFDSLWEGHATKFATNGKTLSPMTSGFTGGEMEGGTFGAALDTKGNAWFTTYGSKAIVVFDKNGKPLTPPKGITFGGRLGLMQGVIVTPSGEV